MLGDDPDTEQGLFPADGLNEEGKFLGDGGTMLPTKKKDSKKGLRVRWCLDRDAPRCFNPLCRGPCAKISPYQSVMCLTIQCVAFLF